MTVWWSEKYDHMEESMEYDRVVEWMMDGHMEESISVMELSVFGGCDDVDATDTTKHYTPTDLAK